VVLVGNSLVFFKDPKSQNPDSWVRLTGNIMEAFLSNKKSPILLSVCVCVCVFGCRNRVTAAQRAVWT